jgi:hypothetical protein
MGYASLTHPTLAEQEKYMRFIVMGLVLTVTGCGIAAKIQARQAYQQATADYDACLSAHSTHLDICEAKRQIMLTDEAEYNNFAAGIYAGGSHAVNVSGRQ